MTTSSANVEQGHFATTHWSLVVSAGQADDSESRRALGCLCETYWVPLYGYVRRRGYSAEDAQDLTQEFFVQLLTHNWVVRADQSRGRFRSFLLMVLKRFLANEWDKVKTQKRGGNVRLESLSELAESQYLMQPAATATPELEFERDWALALLGKVLQRLEEEYVLAGKGRLFESLKGSLTGTGGAAYVEAADALGMTEGAYKVAAHRLRQRYREALREEVAATVAVAEDVEPELRHLFRVLARSGRGAV